MFLERMPPLSRNKWELDRITAIESAISELPNLSQNRYLKDLNDRFGKHIVGQLRELPLCSFIILQEKIQSLITSVMLHCMNTHRL
jgi:hypothetical protein